MGVYKLNAWIKSYFGKCITSPHQPRNTDHVFIDCNQFVHQAVRSAKTFDALWKKLFKRMDDILYLASPKKSVHIVMDGPAPKAKLVAQRKNRKSKPLRASRKNKLPSLVSRKEITPGFKFTGKIAEAMTFYICQRLSNFRYRGVKFFYSGSNVAGEGELKIIEYIKSMPLSLQQKENFMLVGSDSDLILLAISAHVPNVTILSETLGGNKREFASIAMKGMYDQFGSHLPRANPFNVGTDFCVLSILSGNDYLPKCAHVKFTAVWKRYLQLRQTPEWESIDLVNPASKRLNIAFFGHLLSLYPRNELVQPPVNHIRKLKKMLKLRADIDSGVLNKEEIIARYSSISLPVEEAETNDTPIDSDEDVIPADLVASSIDGVKFQSLDGELYQSTTVIPVQTPILQPTPSETMEIDPEDIGDNAEGDDDEEADDLPQRNPIDLFLDFNSRDTWSEYDANDHSAQYIYGLEWVINGYLSGKATSYDWCYPYQSAPGPSQLSAWIKRVLASETVQIPFVPTQSKPIEPWKFGMLLADAASYPSLPDSIPKEFPPTSHLAEIHKTDRFYAYIDVDTAISELSNLRVNLGQDETYATWSCPFMVEFAYPGVTDSVFVPVSPFTSDSVPLRSPFRRTMIQKEKPWFQYVKKDYQLKKNRQETTSPTFKSQTTITPQSHSRKIAQQRQYSSSTRNTSMNDSPLPVTSPIPLVSSSVIPSVPRESDSVPTYVPSGNQISFDDLLGSQPTTNTNTNQPYLNLLQQHPVPYGHTMMDMPLLGMPQLLPFVPFQDPNFAAVQNNWTWTDFQRQPSTSSGNPVFPNAGF